MKPTEPKAVKAWAVVRNGRNVIDLHEVYETHAIACDWCLDDERVIPVTITPGHEAEDD